MEATGSELDIPGRTSSRIPHHAVRHPGLPEHRSFSNQDLTVKVGQGSVLEYLPGSVIPFSPAPFIGKRLGCASKSMGQALICRFLHHRAPGLRRAPEVWRVRQFVEIEYEGKPIVYDRFVLGPKEVDYAGFGLLESHSLCSTIYLIFETGKRKNPLSIPAEYPGPQRRDIRRGFGTLVRGLVITTDRHRCPTI